MGTQEQFIEKITASYNPKGAFINLGSGILDGQVIASAKVNLALKIMNRHGLIAGATGTGKTRTLQLIAEQLSDANVPVFMLDVKGDLSGLEEPGMPNAALEERGMALGEPFVPSGFPVEFFSLSGKQGIPVRIKIMDFGPVLLSRILDLNDTQEGVMNVLFKYASDSKWPIIDLNDVKKILAYLSSGSGAEQIKEDYGKISSATSSTILRKIVSIEQQGVGHIFGEPELDVLDLFQKVDGKGVVSLLNIADVQGQPVVFSTFLLGVLSELYDRLPEVGDLDKPKLVFFFDEAHLLFKNASKAFLSKVEQIIRLIRSKGIGVFFCTQAATDIPESILGQLGNRVQHALRAFTPNDAEALRKTARTYPKSDFYDIEKILTSLGTGQAMITVLNEKGIPTEPVATHLVPPRAVMGPLSPGKYSDLYHASDLYMKYIAERKSRSAADLIDQLGEDRKKEDAKVKPANPVKKQSSNRETPMEAMTKSATRTLGREGVRLLTRLGTALITAFISGKKKR
ncbi:helicase HerA-like domain-containing protein [Olivibacter sitiensis]|uniref:helicase HerA-like domain-containing protein n=1 Tax=Olivibacter sitiensis TaxID=376470 RepID=UPI0004003F42|nr:helicase HerA-like domain-containing protein [Olivibacter sitiensis]